MNEREYSKSPHHCSLCSGKRCGNCKKNELCTVSSFTEIYIWFSDSSCIVFIVLILFIHEDCFHWVFFFVIIVVHQREDMSQPWNLQCNKGVYTIHALMGENMPQIFQLEWFSISDHPSYSSLKKDRREIRQTGGVQREESWFIHSPGAGT